MSSSAADCAIVAMTDTLPLTHIGGAIVLFTGYKNYHQGEAAERMAAELNRITQNQQQPSQ